MEIYRPLKRTEVFGNTRIKEYPTHYEVCVCSKDIFCESGYEERGKAATPQKRVPRNISEAERAENRKKAQRRARTAVRDFALCSDFTHFATLTLNAEHIDRHDYNAVIKKVNRWLSNMVQRRGLAYVIVPELHKDGAIHFHGLFRGDLKLVDSGVKSRRGKIYNLADWKFGFSTVEELDDNYEKAVNYVCKYLSKSEEKIGGRWFLSGGNITPAKVSRADCDWNEVDAPAHVVQQAGLAFKYIRIDKDK